MSGGSRVLCQLAVFFGINMAEKRERTEVDLWILCTICGFWKKKKFLFFSFKESSSLSPPCGCTRISANRTEMGANQMHLLVILPQFGIHCTLPWGQPPVLWDSTATAEVTSLPFSSMCTATLPHCCWCLIKTLTMLQWTSLLSPKQACWNMSLVGTGNPPLITLKVLLTINSLTMAWPGNARDGENDLWAILKVFT